jgi:hypothetical protein
MNESKDFKSDFVKQAHIYSVSIISYPLASNRILYLQIMHCFTVYVPRTHSEYMNYNIIDWIYYKTTWVI